MKIDISKVKTAGSGACFHGEVWVTCPHCGEGKEMMGARPLIVQDEGKVYRCDRCGKVFKVKG